LPGSKGEAGLLIAAAVILIPAIVVLLFAGAAALIEKADMSWPIATLIVGGAVALICVVVASIGCSRLRANALMPDKTTRQLRKDARLIANMVGSDDEYGNDKRAA